MALIDEEYRTDLAFTSDYLSSASGGLQQIRGEANAKQA